jgi:hypothetical protein
VAMGASGRLLRRCGVRVPREESWEERLLKQYRDRRLDPMIGVDGVAHGRYPRSARCQFVDLVAYRVLSGAPLNDRSSVWGGVLPMSEVVTICRCQERRPRRIGQLRTGFQGSGKALWSQASIRAVNQGDCTRSTLYVRTVPDRNGGGGLTPSARFNRWVGSRVRKLARIRPILAGSPWWSSVSNVMSLPTWHRLLAYVRPLSQPKDATQSGDLLPV